MEQVWTWMGEYPDRVIVFGSVGVVIAYLLYPLVVFRLRSGKIPQASMGDTLMVKRAAWEQQDRERRSAEREAVVKMFEDGLVELFASGKISTNGYNNFRDRFFAMLNVETERYVVRGTKEMKELLRKRRNGGTYYGFHASVTIPGPKPGEKVVLNNDKPRNELEALLQSLSKL